MRDIAAGFLVSRAYFLGWRILLVRYQLERRGICTTAIGGGAVIYE